MVKKLLFILPLLFVLHPADAQHCFARVQLDRRSVYVQQPFKVTITVLTTTWYTAPIEFDNLQVPNAFVLPFDKTLPGMYDYNGTQYAGIQFYFIVFPYNAGKFSIPAITVHATTPPEGSSESRRISIKTPIQHYTVKTIPDNIEGNWFVAKSVSIHEHWNKPLSHLKVGDVIERTITVRANGTLPQFIPALNEKTLNFANVYPQDPELKDTRNEYDANGELTQSFIYLLEKEGDFVIPAMPVQWWNPNAGKLNNRSLPQHHIHVNANPDLGMVASIQDSLDLTQQNISTKKSKKEPLLIFGIRWYWFALYAISGLIILFVLFRWCLRISHALQKKYAQYKLSEVYWFRKLLHTQNTWPDFWKHLYQWWDRFDTTDKTSSIPATAKVYDNPELDRILQSGNAILYRKEQSENKVNRTTKINIRTFRKWLMKRTGNELTGIASRQNGWIDDKISTDESGNMKS
jgi:hypothetical protein